MLAKDLIQLRVMTIEDYDQIYTLWTGIKGFGIRSIDDSREGIDRFLKRNPTTSVVATIEGKVVGAILCGHDGRRGCFYHVCVQKEFRMHGIGQMMEKFCREALQKEGVNKVNLIAFRDNPVGNAFWSKLGWIHREDLNYYDYPLNHDNVTNFVK